MVRRFGAASLTPLVFTVLLSAAVLVVSQAAHAELLPARAKVATVTGRAEILISGQTTWRPATVGVSLGDKDEIRTGPGASAELELPDSTNILVAENTRFVVTKLAADPKTQNRVSLFHLAVGKVRAVVAKPAIQLVRARGVNFAISSPSGVAATRGTAFATTYDPGTQVMLVAVIDDEVVLIDFTKKDYRIVPVNNYGTVPGVGIQPLSLLPGNIQSILNSPANPGTANSPALQGVGGQPPSFNQVLTAVVAGLVAGASSSDAAALTASLVQLVEPDVALQNAIIAAALAGAGSDQDKINAIKGAVSVAAQQGPGPGVNPPPGSAPQTPGTPGLNQQVCGSLPCS